MRASLGECGQPGTHVCELDTSFLHADAEAMVKALDPFEFLEARAPKTGRWACSRHPCLSGVNNQTQDDRTETQRAPFSWYRLKFLEDLQADDVHRGVVAIGLADDAGTLVNFLA